MGIWSQASALAARTPQERNRYVDFLRAASILFVITGHWLITTAYSGGGDFAAVMMLDARPWTQWLTWVFQVMPIFFIVGGYSNAVSLESARRRNTRYAAWLAGRLHRLLTPLLLLVMFWAVISLLLNLGGLPAETVAFASRGALLPTWFLAIYTMIVLLAPASYRLWRRWGYLSLFAYLSLAAAVDAAFFLLDWTWLGWTNYFWVWLAAHHLGFTWRDGRLGSPGVLLGIAGLSLLLLAGLIFAGPYPIAMAGSPGEAISNTLPPKITLLALGLFQFGLLLSIEKPMQRWLGRAGVWTGTVLINSMIMTIYLWHMTVLLLVFGLSYLDGGLGFTTAPGSTEWWLWRPAWLLGLGSLLLPIALLLSPLERVAPPAGGPPLPAWRLVSGAVCAGGGLTLATLFGLNGDPLSWSNAAAVALLLGGAVLCGLNPLRGRTVTAKPRPDQ